MTDPDFRPLIAPLLSPGEKIIWAQQPRPHVFVLRAVHSIFYGLTWVVLGLFWFYGAGGVGRDSVFDGWWRLTPVFSLPFVFAGLSFFIYPLQLYLRSLRTWYLVTDRRAITVEFPRNKPPVQRVFSRDEIGRVEITPRWDRLQDLILTRRAQDLPHLPASLDAGFFGLTEGEQARQALDQLGWGKA